MDLTSEASPGAPASSGSTSTPKNWIRPINFRSKIWNHMQHDEKKTEVKCDHCPQLFSFKAGGTSTLQRHLEKVHFIILKKTTAASDTDDGAKEHQTTIPAAFFKYA